MRQIFFLVLLLLDVYHKSVCVEMHALQVKILTYENEDNRVFRSFLSACCDEPIFGGPCEPCDTYFHFCLRVRNIISSNECPSNGRTLVSEVNVDDGPLDVSMSTFLGLPNPFILSGFEDPENFELLIVAYDRDSSTTFEFIDAIIISLQQLRQGEPELFDEEGLKDNIEIYLQLRLICAEGYTGELCDQEVVTESPTTETITTELPTTVSITTELPTTVSTTTEPPTTETITTDSPTTASLITTDSPTTVGTTIESPTTATFTTETLTTAPITTESSTTAPKTTKPPATAESETEPLTSRVTTTELVTTKAMTETTMNKISNTTTTLTSTAPSTPLENCAHINCSKHGVCVLDNNNMISCVCKPGYSGPDCSEAGIQMVSEKRGDDVGSIAGGTTGSLIVIIAMALVLGVIITFALRKKHKQKQVNEEDAKIEQHLPPMIIANNNQDYGMIKNIIYGIQLDNRQTYEAVENIYSVCNNGCDQDESHIYEDVTECVDHFQMNCNIVYKENEHNYS